MQSVGDQTFETMTMPHIDALFQTALHLTESRGAAEQMVRDVYRCAWGFFDGDTGCAEWRVRLFKTLIQRARDRWAKRDHASLSSHSAGQVLAALSQVPPDLRAIILLVDCQEFSYAETADILGLSREAVADAVVLGRARLMMAL